MGVRWSRYPNWSGVTVGPFQTFTLVAEDALALVHGHLFTKV